MKDTRSEKRKPFQEEENKVRDNFKNVRNDQEERHIEQKGQIAKKIKERRSKKAIKRASKKKQHRDSDNNYEKIKERKCNNASRKTDADKYKGSSRE